MGSSNGMRRTPPRQIGPDDGDGADPGGIAEECWPSKRHVTNFFLYFGARRPWQLPGNLFRILGAVTSFLTFGRIRSTMMGEYLLRTDPRVPKVRRSAFDVKSAGAPLE